MLKSASRKKTTETGYKSTDEFDNTVYYLLRKEAKELFAIEIDPASLQVINSDPHKRHDYAERCRRLLKILSTFNIPHRDYPDLGKRKTRTNWTNLLKTLRVNDTLAGAREELSQTDT